MLLSYVSLFKWYNVWSTTMFTWQSNKIVWTNIVKSFCGAAFFPSTLLMRQAYY